MTQRPPPLSKPKYVFVTGNDLESVKLDEDEKVEREETLLELLQPPLGDPCLNALRRILAMTYAGADGREGEIRVADVRRLAIKPLGALGDQLESLKLSRIDADSSYEKKQAVEVFIYMIVPAKELKRRVSVEGSRRKRSLAEIFDYTPADPVLIALRRILSMTFREATTHTQNARIMEDIRYVAATALVPCNPLLEMMEDEPVAMPTWHRFVNGVDTQDGTGEED